MTPTKPIEEKAPNLKGAINFDTLPQLGFSHNKKRRFESYPLHPYWAKEGVVLLYNEGQEDYKYLIGFAEMRMGKYYAVGIRWSDRIEELADLYQAFTGKELTLSPNTTEQ